ncbi:hypothetical protein [Shewanella algae]|nr:hypothetical protein [Shewanella algae]
MDKNAEIRSVLYLLRCAAEQDIKPIDKEAYDGITYAIQQLEKLLKAG